MTLSPFLGRQLPLAWILLAGILFVFSFAPWDLGQLQWLCWAPFFIGIHLLEKQESTLVRLFLGASIMSLIICTGGFYWIVHATQEYGGLPLPAALMLFILFCVIGQLQIPIFVLIRHHVRKRLPFRDRPWLWIAFSGFVYAGVDSLYPKLFLDTAGHAFYRENHFRQVADMGGPFLLSALSVAAGEMLFHAFLGRKNKSKLHTFTPLAAFLLLLSCLYGYGSWRLNQLQQLESAQDRGDSLKVAMIQANIGDFLKIEAERGSEGASRQVISQYLNLSREAHRKTPDLDAVLWPETAYPGLFGHAGSPLEASMESSLRDFSKEFGGWTLFGGYDQANAVDYNSLFFLSPQAKTETYHKNILLMFGETLPFAEYFPEMRSWFPTMGFFGRGPGPQVFTVQNRKGTPFKLAPSICYEGLFPEHSAQGAFLGADALVNITNDSWFGPKGEPFLHLALTTFRSIVTRLPMIRSTNTGFTVVISPTGEITRSTLLNSAGDLTTEIHPRPGITTPFMEVSRVFGATWFARACQMVLAWVLFLGVRRKSAARHMP